MTLTLKHPIDRRTWLAIAGLWSAAVILSTAQIYLRELAYGYSPPLPAVLWANCLAWSPWLLIVPLGLWLERRFPISRDRRRRHGFLHAAIACAVHHLGHSHPELIRQAVHSPGLLELAYYRRQGHYLVARIHIGQPA